MINFSTNLSSLLAQSSLKTSSLKLNEAIERMSTGCKLNHSKDNAANYSIATSLTTKINSYQIAEDNAMMGLDMVQTASSALSTMSDLTTRLRSLAIQAQNGTYSSKSISAINQEAASIIEEINRIKSTTEYNGKKLFKSSSLTPEKASMFTKNKDGFMRDVSKRDTDAMLSISGLDVNASVTSGTYSISTAEELAQLATMTNSGKISRGVEFVLASDIDLSGVDWTVIGLENNKFQGNFDGNGYTISNINNGLFGYAENCSIKNLGIKYATIDNPNALGILAYDAKHAVVENCYATGSLISEHVNIGGLIGWFGEDARMSYCYTEADVTGEGNVGGLVGGTNSTVYTNCYSSGSVSYKTGSFSDDTGVYAAGLIGAAPSVELNNCGSNSIVSSDNDDVVISAVASLWDYLGPVYLNLNDCVYDSSVNPGLSPAGSHGREVDSIIISNLSDMAGAEKVDDTILQVGVSSSESSQLSFNTTISLGIPTSLDMSNSLTLGIIDSFLEELSRNQTNLGAIENRLESVLEEISIQYENLVSSRSTIQDADIAEVSSEYIRQQILQQASATLMATANQTPTIALQLL